jgi:hypothetical protein
MSDEVLDELRRVGEELREAFAQERRAIVALDHASLERLAAHKMTLAYRLAAMRETALATGKQSVKDLFTAIRIEAQATAMLASTAAAAVRTLLGYESTGGYDRRAKPTANLLNRVLTAY